MAIIPAVLKFDVLNDIFVEILPSLELFNSTTPDSPSTEKFKAALEEFDFSSYFDYNKRRKKRETETDTTTVIISAADEMSTTLVLEGEETITDSETTTVSDLEMSTVNQLKVSTLRNGEEVTTISESSSLEADVTFINFETTSNQVSEQTTVVLAGSEKIEENTDSTILATTATESEPEEITFNAGAEGESVTRDQTTSTLMEDESLSDSLLTSETTEVSQPEEIKDPGEDVGTATIRSTREAEQTEMPSLDNQNGIDEEDEEGLEDGDSNVENENHDDEEKFGDELDESTEKLEKDDEQTETTETTTTDSADYTDETTTQDPLLEAQNFYSSLYDDIDSFVSTLAGVFRNNTKTRKKRSHEAADICTFLYALPRYLLLYR